RLVSALGVWTSPGRAFALGGFFEQVRRTALRTFRRDHLVPRREFAFWIAPASVEQLSAPAAPLENLSLFAFGACYSGLDGWGLQPFDPVAIGVTAAAKELPKSRPLADHRLAALVAYFIGWGCRRRLLDGDGTLVVARKLLGVGTLR